MKHTNTPDKDTNTPDASIVLVDDELLIRKSFTRECERKVLPLPPLANGREAIDEVEKGQYDLVITDLNVPVVDGFAVLKAVKKLAPQTCVIILAGSRDIRAAIDALRLGADEFTLRPCEIDEPIFRIRRCLRKNSRSVANNMGIEGEDRASTSAWGKAGYPGSPRRWSISSEPPSGS